MVGLSGGVDSSVAALLLQQQGFNVSGLFMKNWNDDDEQGYCPAEEDFSDAKAIAYHLQIPFYAANFAQQYKEQVFQYFLNAYQQGLTPNPDILCNKEIKFKVFLEHALQYGAEKIATGHYARIHVKNNRYQLLKGRDNNKDQSYFLYTLDQYQLSHALFPLGDYPKPQVRQLAQQYHLITFDKKDSTGICFIGERDFQQFLNRYLTTTPGAIVTLDGTYLGQHQGLIHYTLGQRKGLGIGGRTDSSGMPWFVADKDLKKNQLIVVQGKQHPALYHTALSAEQLHWVAGSAPGTPLICTAKTRYRQSDQTCSLHINQHDNTCEVYFQIPQFAITPGQSIVFYHDEICLGGGIIFKRYNMP